MIATQNPLDRVGTYELPQAQLDRFLFKRQLPPMTNREHLRKIMRIKPGNDEHKSTMPKIGATRIIAASKAIFGRQPDNSDNIRIPPEVEEVILNIPTVIGKRCEPSYQNKDRMKQGSQPSIRTLQRFVPALKTLAWVESKGRAPQVKVDHVRKLCCDLLRHRILLTYEAEAEEVTSEDIITRIIERTPVP